MMFVLPLVFTLWWPAIPPPNPTPRVPPSPFVGELPRRTKIVQRGRRRYRVPAL